jgi:hypothetical protein
MPVILSSRTCFGVVEGSDALVQSVIGSRKAKEIIEKYFRHPELVEGSVQPSSLVSKLAGLRKGWGMQLSAQFPYPVQSFILHPSSF